MKTLQDLVDAIIKRDIDYNMLDLYLLIYFTDVLTARFMYKTCEKTLDAMKINTSVFNLKNNKEGGDVGR